MLNLLRKELSELMNKQMLISLIVSVVMIILVGGLMMHMITQEMSESGILHIIDQDQTPFTQEVADKLREKGYTVETGDDFETMVQTADWKEAVVLPAGMTAAFENHESVELPTYTALTSTSMVKMTMSSNSASTVEGVIAAMLSERYLDGDLKFLENPFKEVPYTRANGKTVQASATSILASVAMFDQFMPLVLFLLVVLTAQTIIAAICSEKLDKTLETLLSSPAPRTQIIGAKMLAALIVAVIYAAVYGISFVVSMLMSSGSGSLTSVGVNGVTTTQLDVGSAFTELTQAHDAVQQLGLAIPGYGWAGVIAQLALTLAIALTAAIILGALTEDAKNAQSASLPIMLCTMLPYMLSMVSDIRGMEGAAKWGLMAIPFTHTFIATGCLRFHDYVTFWGGFVYQAIFLAVMIWLALRLYSSDILFVHSRKYRNKKQIEE
ncbi:MAG: ABC transporter permease [Oscillospiraceae bacterium]|nr:ABC transporter permease [Oscillospiraceae bacterium]